MEASVSNLDLFGIWRDDEDLEVNWLVQKILGPRDQTEKMACGEAFHKALENSTDGDFYTLSAMGYSFRFCGDFDLTLPRLKEVKVSKEYSGLLVKGRVDGLAARVVHELKTTEQFDPGRYLERLQWRFYLDMTASDRFDWDIFQIKETGDKQYDVYAHHRMSQYSYVGLHEDCEKAATEYRRFAEQFLVPVVVP